MYETNVFENAIALDEWLNGRGKPFEIVGYMLMPVISGEGKVTIWVTIKYK